MARPGPQYKAAVPGATDPTHPSVAETRAHVTTARGPYANGSPSPFLMRDDCARMSSPSATDRPGRQRGAGGAPRSRDPEGDVPGVLESLPSARPQRPSARRAAARLAAEAKPAKAADAPAKTAASARVKPAPKTRTTQGTKTPVGPAPPLEAQPARPRRARRTRPTPVEPPVPPQGFEAEEPIEPGRSVQPPSGSELAASVAGLFGELAQAGLSSGGRLVKDALKRLSGA
jgi:hypothetical protein